MGYDGRPPGRVTALAAAANAFPCRVLALLRLQYWVGWQGVGKGVS